MTTINATVSKKETLEAEIDRITAHINRHVEMRDERLQEYLPHAARFDIDDELKRDGERAKVTSRSIFFHNDLQRPVISYEIRKFLQDGSLHRIVSKIDEVNMKGWEGAPDAQK